MLPNEPRLLNGQGRDKGYLTPSLLRGLQPPAHLLSHPDLSLVEIMARFTEHSPQGILLLDENWRIIYANGTAQAEAHIRPQDLNNRIFWEMFPEVVGTVLEETYRRVAATRRRSTLAEYHYAPFDTWADIDVLPMGRGIGTYFRDVTSRVKMQAARDHANEHLGNVLSATTDSVMSVGRDWRILYMNQRGKDDLAVLGNIVGDNLWEVFSDAVYEGSPHLKYHYRAMTEGLPGEFDDYKGHPLNAWFKVIVRPSREGIIIFFRDITQQKRAEAALVENEKLSIVAQLASSIAHQINNPLAALTNLLYLAQQRAEIPEVKQYLQVAEDQLRRVCSITQQSLRLHKQQIDPQLASPAKMLSDVVEVFDSRLRNAVIRVEQRHRVRRPVLCLASDVGQLLSELIGNALAAMGGGGILRLRSREASDWRTGRSGVLLTVSDNGLGIDEATQARMFEPFYTTKDIGGVGLGLWIAADITKRHEGRLQVRSRQSAAHHGTTVTLFLPFQSASLKQGAYVKPFEGRFPWCSARPLAGSDFR